MSVPWTHPLALALITTLLALAPAPAAGDHSTNPHPAPPPPRATDEGFGAATPGGAGQPVCRVRNLDDAGPGSLRDCVRSGHADVVFDVAGTIVVGSEAVTVGPYVTIDGATAPPPGITLTNRGLKVDGALGGHDVIVRHLRVRGAAAGDATDCFAVANGAFNVVLDHVSAWDCADGAIDVTGAIDGDAETRDVTVQWSVLGPTRAGKPMLVKYGTTRLTLHHNLFVGGTTRNPQVTREGDPPDGDTTLDMRNNVVWDWGGGYGTLLRFGVRANVVANLYADPSGGGGDAAQALIVCKGDGRETPATLALCADGAREAAAWGYTRANVSLDGVDLDAVGNVDRPFPAPPVATSDPCTAARTVRALAGAQPRDAVDQALAAGVDLAGCADAPGAPRRARR